MFSVPFVLFVLLSAWAGYSCLPSASRQSYWIHYSQEIPRYEPFVLGQKIRAILKPRDWKGPLCAASPLTPMRLAPVLLIVAQGFPRPMPFALETKGTIDHEPTRPIHVIDACEKVPDMMQLR
jgi:hypothetical protein